MPVCDDCTFLWVIAFADRQGPKPPGTWPFEFEDPDEQPTQCTPSQPATSAEAPKPWLRVEARAALNIIQNLDPPAQFYNRVLPGYPKLAQRASAVVERKKLDSIVCDNVWQPCIRLVLESTRSAEDSRKTYQGTGDKPFRGYLDYFWRAELEKTLLGNY